MAKAIKKEPKKAAKKVTKKEEPAKRGGSRPGAGRKPTADRKKTVSINVLTSRYKALGFEAIKEISLKAVEKAFNKLETA